MNDDILKRVSAVRGLGGVEIHPERLQADTVTVTPGIREVAERARDEIVMRTVIFDNAGRYGVEINKAHDAAIPSTVKMPNTPAPGANNATNTANAGKASSREAVHIRGLTMGLAEQIRRLPPIVGMPLKWAPAIGVGLYLLGHEKAGIAVAAVGIGRYFIVGRGR